MPKHALEDSFGTVVQKRDLVALFLLSSLCLVTVSVLWFFLTVPWVGLQCVIVVFLDHTQLLFLLTGLCRTGFCQNGGSCIGEHLCLCPQGFYGDHCHLTSEYGYNIHKHLKYNIYICV